MRSHDGSVARFGLARRVQRDPCLVGARAQKGLGRGPAAGVVAAHDEANAALGQQGHQPGGRIAPIEHQHIAGSQLVQRLDQLGAFGLFGTVDVGIEHQFGPRQIEREQALIGSRRRAHPVTRPDRWHQHRAVSRNDAQATPARHPAGVLGTRKHEVVEGDQRGHVNMGAGLGKGAVGHRAVQAVGAKERAEEGVEQHLLGLGALAKQGADEGGQGQLASAGEGARMVGVARECRKVFGMQTIREIEQQRLYG